MKTTLRWSGQGEPPKDWDSAWNNLPETEFECERLERGDRLVFSIGLPDGGFQQYSVEIVKVEYGLEWGAKGGVEAHIRASQWVDIKG